MKDFKLFDLENGSQVLYERSFTNPDDESEEQSYEVVAVTHLDGVRVQQAYGYGDDEKTRDAMFEKCDQQRAEDFYNGITRMFIR